MASAAVAPNGLAGVAAIAAGGWHNLALESDGTVVAWGSNGNGQAAVPSGLTGVTAIAAGVRHSLALRSDGTVAAWGQDDYGQTDVPAGLRHVIAVSAGDMHSLALEADGTVVGWGTGAAAHPPAALDHVVAISAGGSHSLALKADGTIVGWGSDASWQLHPPAGLSGITAISAGGNHSLALGYRASGPDVTPPVIRVDSFGTDALGPTGAVDYSVGVWDDFDPAPSLSCRPAAGSTFAIGDTTVTCTAVDASRNSATATFVVHVRGAAEQTAALIDRVVLQKFEKRGLTNSLLAKLTAAQRALLAPSRNNRANARHQLDAFVHEVTAQTGKAVVEPVARDLIGRALRIEAVIG